MEEGSEEVEAAIDDVEGGAGTVGWRWEVWVPLGVGVYFGLDCVGEVGAEDVGFVAGERVGGCEVPDCGIFAEGDAGGYDLVYLS